MLKLRVRELSSFLLGVLLTLSAQEARAEYRLGATLGYGGAGIDSVNSISSTDVNVHRSDGPGMLGLSIEFLTSDTSSISVDHTRGIFISPFSSGVGFTGVTWRWFYTGKSPSVVASQNENSILIVTRRIPFLGLAAGIASGSIYRENDLVPSVSAGGVYTGFHAGYDYQTTPGRFTRIEALYASTPTSSGFVKTALSEFSLQIGMYFIY